MNTQFKKGVIELCVLKLISEKDMYGYEVVQELAKYIAIGENTIYPILRRLTKENHFITYTVENPGSPVRKYYKITEQGKGRYIDLIQEWDTFIDQINQILKRGEIHG
ncbi:MAG: PadR family transcriptional regulator [Bacillales bacterium]|nr:PadR family transcriptional regulator [Bacillales bacterium]